jgi:tripartite-type tricarboxylate transporter receptor subunit TctC
MAQKLSENLGNRFSGAGCAIDPGRQGARVTGKTRLEGLPSVPTLAEAGYPDILGDSWFGFVVPIGTPKQIVALHHEIVKINALPEMKPRLATLGVQPVADSPEEFADLIKVDLERWRKVIRAAGVKVE